MNAICPCCAQPLPASKTIVDTKNRVLIVDGNAIEMSNIEIRIADLLWRRSPGFVTRESIYDYIYSMALDGGPGDAVVNVWICKIRAKLIGTRLHLDGLRRAGYALLERNVPYKSPGVGRSARVVQDRQHAYAKGYLAGVKAKTA